jgi:hypothetical protein
MRRILLSVLVLSLVQGCQLPPERVPIQPLPEGGPPLPYAELLTRARAQAMAATEAYYVNRWTDVEDMGKAIEQTAKYLAKAEEVPAKNKDNLNELSGDLAKEAKKLREAAAARNIDATNEALKSLNARVRALRLTD